MIPETTETPVHWTELEENQEMVNIFGLKWFEKAFLGMITVCMGLVGNLLSFGLLSRQRFRNTAAGFYMRALSLADFGIMVALLGNHTMRLFEVPIHSSVHCKIIFFIAKWLMSVSDWVLATMCLERSIAVSMPLKSKEILKPKLNRIALAVVIVILGGYYTYVFIAYGSANGICRTVSMAYPVAIRTMVDYALVFIPAIVILGSNIVIIVCLSRAARVQMKLTEDGSSSRSTQQSLTAMLLSISIAFIILKSPYFIVKAILPSDLTRNIGFTFQTRFQAVNRIIISVFINTIYFNHAINFYLYILSGREYRHEIRAILSLRNNSASNEATSSTALSEIKNKGNTV